jgi:hypothetical protein
MFDKYMIVEDSLVNVDNGFAFKARLPYYRGLGLSMVEEIAVTVDGKPYPRDSVRLTLRGKTYTLAEMETVFDDRWNFGEEGTVTVIAPPLSDGGHLVDLNQRLRVSYLPFPLTGKDHKRLSIGEDTGLAPQADSGADGPMLTPIG